MQPSRKQLVLSLGIALVAVAGGPSIADAAGAIDGCGGVLRATYRACVDARQTHWSRCQRRAIAAQRRCEAKFTTRQPRGFQSQVPLRVNPTFSQ